MKYSKLLLLTISCVTLFSSCREEPSVSTSEETKRISIATGDEPQSVDPRLIRDIPSVNVAHMLFEGLTKKNRMGALIKGIAKEITTSDNGLTYTFQLRESFWSDGSPLTAEDFAYSIMSIVSPEFPSPNASQLYVIKGAKEAKKGILPISELGVKVVDPQTLEIELEKPTPHFLELTSTYFFMPVKKSWGEKDTNNPIDMPTNGPFTITEWQHNNSLSLSKNPHYWNSRTISLDGIDLIVVDENTALQMFERGNLDWIGSPISFIPPDAIPTLLSQKRLIISPADGVHLFRLNTEHPLLSNKKFRKALAYSINRKEICDHIAQANQQPAMAIVPPSFALQNLPCFEDNNITEAWSLLQEAIKEEGVSIDELPKITLLYTQSDRNQKIVQAVQQQWKKSLGIEVTLEASDHAIFYDRMNRQDYDISIGSWYGDYRDPINFLEVFKYKQASTNNTLWENEEYINLLDQSAITSNEHERTNILSKAERLLMDEMPTIPIYFSTFNHMQRGVSNGSISPLGILQISEASKNN